MRSSIYLIGGGELRDGETYQIDEDLKSLAPKGSTFVFLALLHKIMLSILTPLHLFFAKNSKF